MRVYIAQVWQLWLNILGFVEFERQVLIVRWYGLKIIFWFPRETWLSYRKVVALGCPEEHANVTIAMLVRIHSLETRISFVAVGIRPDELEPDIAYEISRLPFDERDVELFEYRLVRHDTPTSDRQHDPLHVPAFALGC